MPRQAGFDAPETLYRGKELEMLLKGVARLLGVSTSAISKILHRIVQESSK